MSFNDCSVSGFNPFVSDSDFPPCAHFEQVQPDQSGHLDAANLFGMLVLINFMLGPAWLGIYLNSGGSVHALKLLEEKEYKMFCEQLPLVPSAEHPQKKLIDEMQGQLAQKTAIAWRLYAGAKLKALGFGDQWERKYLELEEFHLFLGSFSVFHFGTRFPLRFRPQSESVPRDLWHLRGHLYVARRRVTDPSGRHHFNFAEPELSTVNLFDCTECKGLEAATQYLDAPFNLPDLAD